MFSANENLVLRQHKRRITSYIESTMPPSALDAGTMVMVMQLSCKAPGCVPLETAVTVVFPRSANQELIPGIAESGSGGIFKTKILLPMDQVTLEDVLDALPPEFEGGRRTMEKCCLRVRDAMFGQIVQVMGAEKTEDDGGVAAQGRKLMSEYLMECLKEYIERGCVAPPIGQAFPPLNSDAKNFGNDGPVTAAIAENHLTGEKFDSANTAVDADRPSAAALTDGSKVVQGTMTGTGNFIIRRTLDDEGEAGDITIMTNDSTPNPVTKAASKTIHQSSTFASSNIDDDCKFNLSNTNDKPTVRNGTLVTSESAMEWRRRQNLSKSMDVSSSYSSQSIIQRLSEREHAPGVRRAGCPCCDPDNPSNVVDAMLML